MSYRDVQNKYFADNTNRLYNNKKFMAQLATAISVQLDRHLNDEEVDMIINYVKQIDPVMFVNRDPKQVFQSMVNGSVELLRKRQCHTKEEYEIDVKELLKKDMDLDASGTSAVDAMKQVQAAATPQQQQVVHRPQQTWGK